MKTLTPGTGMHSSEMEIKKSRFLGYACHVESWMDARLILDQVKAQHPKARHWCYGFRGGQNPITERSSDDGEPSGTAGAPILAALRSEGLSNSMCVVVRYFGGVKLGAGGLIRAYGGAARMVLADAPSAVLIPMSTVKVKVPPEYIGAVYDTASKMDATTSEEDYGNDGGLTVKLTCRTVDMERLHASLGDATKGTAAVVES